MKLWVCAALLLLAAGRAPAATLYVATDGNDRWSGTLAAANKAKTDGPFATLERARDEVRKLKAAGPLPKGGVSVQVRRGMYALPQTLKLGPEDSGTAEAPVVYQAYPGERPILIGGRQIAGFTPYRGKILKAAVSAHGFQGIAFRQLFFDGERQHLARYPNFNPKNPYGGGWAYADGKPVPMYSDVPGEDRRTLQYKEKDARTWSRPQEGEVFVFPRYNWWNNIVRIQSVDRGKRIVTLAGDCSYAIRPTDRYYVQGPFEELDAPGEWYLDKESGTLYFWPPKPLKGRAVYAPTMRTIIEVADASYITFRGLTIECCEGTAVVLNKTTRCLVAGCTVRNAGDYNGSGVAVNGGSDNSVVGNDIYAIGSHGVSLSGGDRTTLTPGNNVADNNYIHHVGVYYKQGVGIAMSGCGQRASHNLIHDGPRMGIMFSGNNLVIEYNHIRHMNLETEDTGAVYTGGRDWISSRGTVVRYNYFHDILGYGQMNGKWVSPHFAWGVYLDDNTGGVDVIGNIIQRCPRAGIHLHNGRDNLIENNIILDSAMQQMEMNGWTPQHRHWVNHFKDMVRGYESVVNQPAWKGMRNMETHPSQAVLPDGLIMTGNVFKRNIIAYSDSKAKCFRFSRVPFDHNEFDNNLIWHGGKPILVEGLLGVDPEEQWAEWQKRGKDTHSVVADPLFVNAKKGNYRLRSDSPALKLGFQQIPVEQIGPYKSELRATWPIVEAEGAREKPLGAERPEAAATAASSPRYEKPFPAPRIARPAAGAFLPSGPALALSLKETPGRTPIGGAACTARVAHDGECLYLTVTIPAAAAGLKRGSIWGQDDGVEVCFRDAGGRKPGPIFVLHGFAGGRHESVTEAGASLDSARRLGEQVRFTAKVSEGEWVAQWAIPLAAAGITVRPGIALGFNLGVHRPEADGWICWAGALAQTWQVGNAGVLLLE